MSDIPIASELALQSRVSIPFSKQRLWADTIQPAAPIGWLVLTRLPGDHLEQVMAGEIARQALEAGWAALILDSTTTHIARAAEHLRAATLWLRAQPEAQGLPVAYVGPGRAAAVALQAATHEAPVMSVLTWNGRPDLAWSQLRSVQIPSLLMVDRHAPRLTRWLNQLARRQMGPTSEFALTSASSPINATGLEWLRRPRSHLLRARAPRSRLAPLSRGLMSGALVLAFLASPLTGARSAQVHKLNFADSQVVTASQVKGDGVGQTRSNKRAVHDTRFANSVKLKGKHVKGDGVNGPNATGSKQLVDAQGLKFFVNTNITFNTSSSASGAASEASFVHPVAASTLNGGTVASTPNDEFDGYGAVCLSLNGATGPCSTGNPSYTIYNKNGAPALTCDGVVSPTVKRQVVYNNQNISNTLTVSRKVFVPDNDQFIRWMTIVTNTSGVTNTVSLVTSNNLGSDVNTKIFNSSTGVTNDITSTVNAPFWVGTFQNYAITTTTDVRTGAIMYGPNARVGLSSIHYVNGNDKPYWAYNLTLAPAQTQIVMTFVTGQFSKAAVTAKATALVNLPSNALQCMTPAEQGQVVNFAVNHIITPTAGLHGVIIPGTPQTVTTGSAITFTIAPDKYYRILDVGVDGVSQGRISSYQFTNVTANHTISATFEVTPIWLPIIRR